MTLNPSSSLPSNMGYPTFFLGDASNPAVDVDTLEFEFAFDTIIDLYDYSLLGPAGTTFLNPDGNLGIDIEVDEVQKTISVTLARTDGVGQSGYGLILTCGGIAIIDNIDARVMPAAIFEENSIPSHACFAPNPAGETLRFVSENPGQLSIYSLDGQLLATQLVQSGRNQVAFPEHAEGMFIYRFSGPRGYSSGKFMRSR